MTMMALTQANNTMAIVIEFESKTCNCGKAGKNYVATLDPSSFNFKYLAAFEVGGDQGIKGDHYIGLFARNKVTFNSHEHPVTHCTYI